MLVLEFLKRERKDDVADGAIPVVSSLKWFYNSVFAHKLNFLLHTPAEHEQSMAVSSHPDLKHRRRCPGNAAGLDWWSEKLSELKSISKLVYANVQRILGRYSA